MDKCCTDRCYMDTYCMDKCCMVKWYWATCQQSRMLYQLSLLSLNYYPGGVGGWVGGSNGNKANLSPAEAGAGLSLAISASLNNLFQIGCTIIFMSAKLGTKKMLLRKRLGPKQILGPKKIWTVGSEGVGEVRGVWGSGQLR